MNEKMWKLPARLKCWMHSRLFFCFVVALQLARHLRQCHRWSEQTGDLSVSNEMVDQDIIHRRFSIQFLRMVELLADSITAFEVENRSWP